jgi:hypothetical protein
LQLQWLGPKVAVFENGIYPNVKHVFCLKVYIRLIRKNDERHDKTVHTYREKSWLTALKDDLKGSGGDSNPWSRLVHPIIMF